ncbi:MAG: TIR domain-containing protein [Desulfobacteraceae bacterium]|nr:TIR domain-containing protein [Desulfobacteraceae bacterium]
MSYSCYKVLDNKEVIRNLGRFTKADLAKIWNEDNYAGMQDELLQLMINFKLCYKISETQDTYIAPQLLTENQPKYKWAENSLILRYVYEFMPKGIINRFIVATHKMIAKQKLVWKSGVILERDKTFAELIEYYGKREIKIRIAGRHKKELMTIVTHELNKIHDSYNNLKYDKMIPCNCITCKGNQKPHFYPFDELREFISDGQNKIQCRKKPYKMVSVRGLIDDVAGWVYNPSKMAGYAETANNVFISYAEQDYQKARKLCNDLENAGITTWLDKKDLLPGQNWRKVIPHIIRQSSHFLLLISSHSLTEQGYVQKEQKIALEKFDEFPENEIFIIPVRLDNIRPLDEKLQNIHWADLSSSYKKGFEQILRVLNS